MPSPSEFETYQATAPSNITVQVRPDGLVVHQRSVRYEVFAAIPDDIKVGVLFSNRLATITAVSDGEIDDQTNTIEVTVDALSGSALGRLHSALGYRSPMAYKAAKEAAIAEHK